MSDSAQRFTERWDAIDPFDESYPHLWVKVEHLGRYQFASRYLGSVKAKSVIDIGCGLGYGAVELAKNVESVLAVDQDADILEYAKAAYGHPRVDYRAASTGTGELSNIFRDESVPAVVAFETLEHMSDPVGALWEFGALLRRGGTIILSVPSIVSESVNDMGLPFNREHKRFYTVSSISALLESAGF
jgi:2-polyprenyl-3-methyl-5-hydroxy-6-metoxy-1,4-benzoquinol methylase